MSTPAAAAETAAFTNKELNSGPACVLTPRARGFGAPAASHSYCLFTRPTLGDLELPRVCLKTRPKEVKLVTVFTLTQVILNSKLDFDINSYSHLKNIFGN